MEQNKESTKHEVVFFLLSVLVLSAVGIHFLSLAPMLNNLLVLGIALTMAGLVAAQYMGLKWEGRWVAGVLIVPLMIVAVLMLILLPDLGGIALRF